MALWVHDINQQLRFSPKTACLLVREQGLDNPDQLHVLTNKNVNEICNIMMKPGGKNANGMHDKGQQVLAKAQDGLKLAVFLFHNKADMAGTIETIE